MAVSQSLTSIMEEMVTKVMEDAVSTSIILTQVPVKEVHKVEKYARRNFVGNIVTILSFFTCDQRVAYRLGKLSNAEISDFSASRRVSRVEPPISSTFDKLGEGSAGEGTLARW